ncbi:MAG TPA: TatD family hydrolase [Saprospiraceae bacterium]|nr:TatD family hydrolase [Saprospiraceae bacterium]
MLPYLDLHTHSPTPSPQVRAVLSVHWGQADAPASDWQSAGLHPWHLAAAQEDDALHWLHRQAALPGTVAIGEAGLDKVTATPWAAQLWAFGHCAAAAESAGKPLIVHCVRAYGEILALREQWRPAQAWIFHGFDKHPHTAQMLLRAGCFLSFGSALLNPRSHAAAALCDTPAERFFLETDISKTPVEMVYARAAALRGCPVEVLRRQIWANARSVGLPPVSG